MEGIGIDMVDIARFGRYAGKPESAFCQRVYTDYEREYIKDRGPATMAGLFAAKEAVAKALGTGFAGISPKEIEITHGETGAPQVKLRGRAGEAARGKAVIVSITHTKTAAAAVAYAGTPGTNGTEGLA